MDDILCHLIYLFNTVWPLPHLERYTAN